MFLQTPGTDPQLGRMPGVAGGGYSRRRGRRCYYRNTRAKNANKYRDEFLFATIWHIRGELVTLEHQCDEKRKQCRLKVRQFWSLFFMVNEAHKNSWTLSKLLQRAPWKIFRIFARATAPSGYAAAQQKTIGCGSDGWAQCRVPSL